MKPDAEAEEAAERVAEAKASPVVKPTRRKAKAKPKPKPKRAELQVAHIHLDAPEGMRPGPMAALARDLNRVFRDHSARGRWVVTFDRERVSPQNRGKAK